MQIWVFNAPDDEAVDFIYSSLQKGISRFGWGYFDGADLNKLDEKDWDDFSEDENKCYRKASFLRNIEVGDWIVHINVPKWGFCSTAKVIDTYKFEEENNELGDYRHYLRIDTASLVTFNRNDPNILPYICRRLKLQGHYWTIKNIDAFIQSIENLKSNSVSLENDITHGLYHLKIGLKPNLLQITKRIQENHPGKKLEDFFAYIFERVPNVVSVKRNGSGWGTDFGADLIITYNTGIPILDLQTTETMVVQIKSYIGICDDNNAITQIETAIKKYNSKSGLIITTAIASDNFKKNIELKANEIGCPIGLISGEDVASFTLKYGSDLLFEI